MHPIWYFERPVCLILGLLFWLYFCDVMCINDQSMMIHEMNGDLSGWWRLDQELIGDRIKGLKIYSRVEDKLIG